MANQLVQTNDQQSFWMWLIHSDAENRITARQGRLAAVMLLLSEAVTLLALIIFAITRDPDSTLPTDSPLNFVLAGIVFILLALLFYINRKGATYAAGTSLAVVVFLVNIAILLQTGPLSPGAVALVVPVIIAGLLGPPIAALMMAVAAIAAYYALSAAVLPSYGFELFTRPEYLQTGLVYLNIAFVAAMSWLFSRTTRQALNESQELSQALITQQQEIEHQLDIQTRYLRATVQVARSLAGERDFDRLLTRMVSLIRDTYGYYHVRLFLLDEDSEYAVLRQSTTGSGELSVSKGHRLRVGSTTAIGQATYSGRPVILRDARHSTEVSDADGLLPQTRSAAALPLLVGDDIIGALYLQSTDADDFPEESVPTLRSLADQLAIAIENSLLFKQTQENLRELTELSQLSTERSWREFLTNVGASRSRQIFGPESKILELHRDSVIERVLSSGTPIASSGKDGRQGFMATPVFVRNQVVGVIGVEPDEAREWTREDLQLLEGIAQRTSLAIENARLYLQARRAAERERMINEISSRLQNAANLDLLLQTAARELAEVLGTDNIYAEINLDPTSATSKVQTGKQPEETSIDDAVEGTATPTQKHTPTEQSASER